MKASVGVPFEKISLTCMFKLCSQPGPDLTPKAGEPQRAPPTEGLPVGASLQNQSWKRGGWGARAALTNSWRQESL